MTSRRQRDIFSELEAAQHLGISLQQLHLLLDLHVFNVSHPRPPQCSFQYSDLLLMEYWLQLSLAAPGGAFAKAAAAKAAHSSSSNILRMPKP